MDPVLQRLLIGFGVTLVFGIVAFMTEMVDDMGFFAGVIIFSLIYVFLDWQSYAIIVAFFGMTGLAINIENREKAKKGEFELYKAKRPIERVLGRSLGGVIFAALFFITSQDEFKLAFVASYAEAIFDTVSTKLGKLLSKKARVITTFKVVHHGSPGGVSVPGTILGSMAAFALGSVGLVTRLVEFNDIIIITIAAFMGSLVDSYLNAVSSRERRIPNEFINFSGSIAAGIICIVLKFAIQVLTGRI